MITAAVVLAGCTGTTEPPKPASTPSASTSGPIFPDSSTFTPAPQGAIDEDSGETHGPRTVPTWDDSSRQSAIAAAQTVMLAYARPGLRFDEWWANLQPLLDQKATQDYAYMDPSRIVATTITGPPVITDETSAYVAYVDVPTDAGMYG
ncbi:hypothetical protein, partial [Microbacterium sp. LMI1-1-1.1]|uniref:hypothetical protein n=1 Tax=Microbacterium sp. LMI1-1-1.1 TaxID=3135223 RepID=UPI003465D457